MKTKRIFFFLRRIIYFFIIMEAAVIWKAKQMDEELFWYDFKSGFIDVKEQRYFFIVYGIVALVIVLFITLCCLKQKNSLVFQWKIQLGKKKKVRYVSTGTESLLWAGAAAVCLLLGTVIFYNTEIRTDKFNVWEGSEIVGHSFGQIDEYPYTGSLEAFQYNYEKGYRTFEVDMEVTSDGKVVLRHDWDFAIQENVSSANIPTEEEFLSIPIYGKYTPLSFSDLCKIMKEHPDIWVVTDTKYTMPEDVSKQFAIMVNTAEELGMTEVLDRMIVQIYNEPMLDYVRSAYPFKSYIFTLYQRWGATAEEFIEIARWSVEHDIDVITMDGWRATEEIMEIAERYDLDIYVHTVNDSVEAKEHFQRGVKGIYTDKLGWEEIK